MESDQTLQEPELKEKENRPNCFADLNKVFPIRPDGLRHTPDICLACSSKTDCLRAAMAKKEGLQVHAEKVDRAYHSGVIGFIERWARRKELHRKINS